MAITFFTTASGARASVEPPNAASVTGPGWHWQLSAVVFRLMVISDQK